MRIKARPQRTQCFEFIYDDERDQICLFSAELFRLFLKQSNMMLGFWPFHSFFCSKNTSVQKQKIRTNFINMSILPSCVFLLQARRPLTASPQPHICAFLFITFESVSLKMEFRRSHFKIFVKLNSCISIYFLLNSKLTLFDLTPIFLTYLCSFYAESKQHREFI